MVAMLLARPAVLWQNKHRRGHLHHPDEHPGAPLLSADRKLGKQSGKRVKPLG